MDPGDQESTIGLSHSVSPVAIPWARVSVPTISLQERATIGNKTRDKHWYFDVLQNSVDGAD